MANPLTSLWNKITGKDSSSSKSDSSPSSPGPTTSLPQSSISNQTSAATTNPFNFNPKGSPSFTVPGGGSSSGSSSSGSSLFGRGSSNSNTYNPATGVYIDSSGQGMSTAKPPAGSTVVGTIDPTQATQPIYNNQGQLIGISDNVNKMSRPPTAAERVQYGTQGAVGSYNPVTGSYISPSGAGSTMRGSDVPLGTVITYDNPHGFAPLSGGTATGYGSSKPYIPPTTTTIEPPPTGVVTANTNTGIPTYTVGNKTIQIKEAEGIDLYGKYIYDGKKMSGKEVVEAIGRDKFENMNKYGQGSERIMFNEFGDATGVESDYLGMSMSLEAYDKEVSRLEKVTPQTGVFNKKTGELDIGAVQDYTELELGDFTAILKNPNEAQVYVDPQTGKIIENIGEYISLHNIPTSHKDSASGGSIQNFKDRMKEIQLPKTYDLIGLGGTQGQFLYEGKTYGRPKEVPPTFSDKVWGSIESFKETPLMDRIISDISTGGINVGNFLRNSEQIGNDYVAKIVHELKYGNKPGMVLDTIHGEARVPEDFSGIVYDLNTGEARLGHDDLAKLNQKTPYWELIQDTRGYKFRDSVRRGAGKVVSNVEYMAVMGGAAVVGTVSDKLIGSSYAQNRFSFDERQMAKQYIWGGIESLEQNRPFNKYNEWVGFDVNKPGIVDPDVRNLLTTMQVGTALIPGGLATSAFVVSDVAKHFGKTIDNKPGATSIMDLNYNEAKNILYTSALTGAAVGFGSTLAGWGIGKTVGYASGRASFAGKEGLARAIPKYYKDIGKGVETVSRKLWYGYLGKGTFDSAKSFYYEDYVGGTLKGTEVLGGLIGTEIGTNLGQRTVIRTQRSLDYRNRLKSLEAEFGKNSPEVDAFKQSWEMAFGDLSKDIGITTQKDWSSKHIEAIANDPEAQQIVDRLVRKHGKDLYIIGTTTITPQTDLNMPPRGLSGDADVTRGTKEFAEELYLALKAAGKPVTFTSRVDPFGKGDIFHVGWEGKEFFNIHQDALGMTYAQARRNIDFFDDPTNIWRKDSQGVNILNLRDQARAKVLAGWADVGIPKGLTLDTLKPAYLSGTDIGRAKDIIDVVGIAQGHSPLKITDYGILGKGTPSPVTQILFSTDVFKNINVAGGIGGDTTFISSVPKPTFASAPAITYKARVNQVATGVPINLISSIGSESYIPKSSKTPKYTFYSPTLYNDRDSYTPYTEPDLYKPIKPYKAPSYDPVKPYKPSPYEPISPYKPTPYDPIKPYKVPSYDPVKPYKPSPYDPIKPYKPTPYKPLTPFRPERPIITQLKFGKRATPIVKTTKQYQLEIRRRGKFRAIKMGTEDELKALGVKLTSTGLGRTFRLKETGKKQEVFSIDGNFNPDTRKFRQSVIRQGKETFTPKQFIQRTKHALSSRGELREIQQARWGGKRKESVLNQLSF